MNFWKKYVPSDEIKLRDEITKFDCTSVIIIRSLKTVLCLPVYLDRKLVEQAGFNADSIP